MKIILPDDPCTGCDSSLSSQAIESSCRSLRPPWTLSPDRTRKGKPTKSEIALNSKLPKTSKKNQLFFYILYFEKSVPKVMNFSEAEAKARQEELMSAAQSLQAAVGQNAEWRRRGQKSYQCSTGVHSPIVQELFVCLNWFSSTSVAMLFEETEVQSCLSLL